MKTVYINGRFLTQRITGVQRFAREILSSLDKNLETQKTSNINYKILVPGQAHVSQNYKNIEIQKIGFFKGHFWEQIFLPIFSYRKPLLCLCNTGPILKRK